VRSPPPEEDRVAETTRDELTATPIPHALAPEIEKNGSKMKPGKNRGVGEGVLEIWVYFLLPFSILIGNKLN